MCTVCVWQGVSFLLPNVQDLSWEDLVASSESLDAWGYSHLEASSLKYWMVGTGCQLGPQSCCEQDTCM
jgi:hypothetical protein